MDAPAAVLPRLDEPVAAPTPPASEPRRWFGPALGLVGLVAGIAHFWALTSVGWGNGYYAAAVRSMGSSWHAFFYNSFDSAGFVSVDKPPLSLWVQVLSTKVLGYTMFGVLAPQALAATASVLILGVGVRRSWGRVAGIAAAAALAVVPINVMVAHSNNTDAVLVLLMTGAAVLALEAARRGRLRWLVGASVVGGLCITAKMAAGAPVLPGMLVAYLWCAPRAWKVRAWGTPSSAALTMAVVGLSWFVAVQLTPASSRPYVGSTQHNSVFELAFERNGVNQVEGNGTGAGPGGGGGPRAGGRGVGGGGNGGAPGSPFGLGFSGGTPGGLRLLNRELGSQAGWLLPMAVAGAIGALVASRLRPSPKLSALIVFGSWLAGAGTVFSITKGIVHPYYLAGIGAPIAALAGIAIGRLRIDVMERRRTLLFGLAGLAGTAAAQWTIVRRFAWRPWVAWAALLLIGVAALVACVAWLRRAGTGRLSKVAVATALAAPLLAPAMWIQGSLASGLNPSLPYAVPFTGLGSGPANLAGGLVPNGGTQFPAGDSAALISWLRAHRSGERFLVGVPSAASAEGIIIHSGEPVMAMGGFIGSDPILTQETLSAQIDAGVIRYFLLPAGSGLGGPGGFGGFIPGGGQPNGQNAPAAPPQDSNFGGLLPDGNTATPNPTPAFPNRGFLGGPGGGPAGFGGFGGFGNGLTSWVTSTCTEVPATEWASPDSAADQGSTAFPGGPTGSTFSLYDCRPAAGA